MLSREHRGAVSVQWVQIWPRTTTRVPRLFAHHPRPTTFTAEGRGAPIEGITRATHPSAARIRSHMKSRSTDGTPCTGWAAEAPCTGTECIAMAGGGCTTRGWNPNRRSPTVGTGQVSQPVAPHQRHDLGRRGENAVGSVRIMVRLSAPNPRAPGATVTSLSPLLQERWGRGWVCHVWSVPVSESEIQMGDTRAEPMVQRYREDTLRRVPLSSVPVSVSRAPSR